MLKKRNGKIVTIYKRDFNTIAEMVVFKEISNNSSYDDKIIFADVDIEQGDIVELEGNKYIVISDRENINNVYSKFIVRKLYKNIKVYINNELKSVDCFIDTNAQAIQDSLPFGAIKLTVQENKTTNKIGYDLRFITMGNVYKVVGFTSEYSGLKYIYAEKDVFTDFDDMENGIADYWKYNTKHGYALVAEPTTTTLNEGDTLQLNVTVTDTVNNITNPIENPTLIYTSNDETIATVSETGLITAIAEGITTINIKFVGEDGTELTKTVSVTVQKKEEVHNYSVVLEGNSTLKEFTEENYVAKLLDNGVEVPSQFDFSIDYNGNDSKIATLEIIDDNTVKLIANQDAIYGTIKLVATNRADSNLKAEMDIKVISLF